MRVGLSRSTRPRILSIPLHSGGNDVVLSRRWKHALLTLAIVLTCTQLLFAHAILMESTPKLNSTVKGPDVEITLRYNVRIDGSRSRVLLMAPDGSRPPLTLAKQSSRTSCRRTPRG